MKSYKDLWGNKLKKIKEDKKISERNRELIFQYLDNKQSEKVTYRRLLRISEILVGFIRGNEGTKNNALKKKDCENTITGVRKDLDKVTDKDLRRFVTELENSDYAEWTKYTYKVVIRNFYKDRNEGDLPKMCRFMNMSLRKIRRNLPQDIWLEEEIARIVSQTRDPFWRAFIMFGFESGARIGELLNMRIKDVKFNDCGARVRLDGKTGPREILVVKSVPHLASFINTTDREQSSWLWTNKGKKISDAAVRKTLRVLAQKQRILKPTNPHLVFRKSRATQMAKYLTEAQMKQYFGWTQDSKAVTAYILMNGRDLDPAILQMNGLKPQAKVDKSNLPVKCPRCGASNQGVKFCGQCGSALDEKTAQEANAVLEQQEAFMKQNQTELMAMVRKMVMQQLKELDPEQRTGRLAEYELTESGKAGD